MLKQQQQHGSTKAGDVAEVARTVSADARHAVTKSETAMGQALSDAGNTVEDHVDKNSATKPAAVSDAVHEGKDMLDALADSNDEEDDFPFHDF